MSIVSDQRIAAGACQACGDDDASHHLCSDCLTPGAEAVERIIADCLGGKPNDYEWIAQRIVEEFGA